MTSREKATRPWEHSTFFEVDGIPVVETLKSQWRELAQEYESAKNVQVPYGLDDVFTGNWLTGAFRSHPLELAAMRSDVKRAAVASWFPDGGRSATDAEVDATYEKLWEMRMKRNRARCPLLTSILEPLYPHACITYLYSTMVPGTRISPHHGMNNDCLRIHLCLKEADNCWLNVRDERRTWHNGQAWAFDDSNLHSAVHDGTADRAVLIVDFTKSYMERQFHDLASTRYRAVAAQ
jgi:aspartyl/asparaginyl beta-hydroxylase (cupin superfamily)